jgi:hypothetical protein
MIGDDQMTAQALAWAEYFRRVAEQLQTLHVYEEAVNRLASTSQLDRQVWDSTVALIRGVQ